jgi:hypothetical protein
MKNTRFFFLLGLLLFSMAQVHAQASLSFQGALQKASGANFDDGEYAMTFRLYESETGGSAVWSETQDAVDVLGGVFNTLLGQVNPLNAAFDKTYFLGISVNYGVEMVPRIRLTASPYSLSLIGQNNIFPSTGAVGAGYRRACRYCAATREKRGRYRQDADRRQRYQHGNPAKRRTGFQYIL